MILKCLKENVGIIRNIGMQEVRNQFKNALEKKWENPDYYERNYYESFSEYEEKKWNDFVDDHDDHFDDRESYIRFYRILKLKT